MNVQFIFILRKMHLAAWFNFFLVAGLAQENIGIGTNNPHPSAVLDVTATNKGFLPPRMTFEQRNAIVSPAAGLTLFNITSNCLETWDGFQWYGPCIFHVSSYPVGSVFCSDIVTKIVPVLNPVTGKIWMDRNLGASQVATSSTDAASYGDLYQWGRRADGHQCRNSGTTPTLSNNDQPAHDDFILANNSPYDWRSPQNSNLWQGVSGVNNPCPSGYRLPTETELNNERLSWGSNNAAGAFASPLRFSLAGYRDDSNGALIVVGSVGFYWSSTISSTFSRFLYFNINNGSMNSDYRAHGFSARCLKD